MPVFDFKCKDCGEKFEKLIFKEEEIKNITCPKCGSKNIEKLLSGFRIGGTENSSSCSVCSSGSCSSCSL